MNTSLFQYIRNNRGQRTGLLLAEVGEMVGKDVVLVSVSSCSKKDRFDRTRGYDIARGRIRKRRINYKISNRAERVLPGFVSRVYQYFKKPVVVLGEPACGWNSLLHRDFADIEVGFPAYPGVGW